MSLLSAHEIVEWSSNMFGDGLVVTTSFGIQSAVMLHLATQVRPDIPVVWIDTGYLPEETYRFASELTDRLDLNLRTYRAEMSPEEMEEVYDRLWESNEVEHLNLYDRIRKIEPLERAMREARATARGGSLQFDLGGAAAPSLPARKTDVGSTPDELTLDDIKRMERDVIVAALEQSGWRVHGEDGAAGRLGLKPTTLSSKMKKMGIQKPS